MHHVTIASNTRVAHDTHKICASVDKNEPYFFLPGQFCMINIPCENKTVPRAFSFASDSEDPQNLVWYVKILRDTLAPHPASVFFEHCAQGDALTIEPAKGMMLLPKILPEKLVYIATTTGIAPFLSHFYEIARINPQQNIELIFGCRNEEDMFAQDELEKFSRALPNLRITTPLSQPNTTWTGAIGRVTQFIPKHTPDENIYFYQCGNKHMIIDAKKILTQNGILHHQMKFEIYF